MKLLSKSASQKLADDLAELEDFRQQAKEDRDKNEIKRLKTRITEINERHEEEIVEIEQEHNHEVKVINREHDTIVGNLEDKLSDSESIRDRQVKKLEGAKSTDHSMAQRELTIDKRTKELDVRENELAHRDTLVKGREDLVGKIETAVADAKKAAEVRLEDVRAEGHKSGYADGIADGLRKCHELQSEDRDLISRLATISIAQGNDSLKDQLSEIVSNNLKDILVPPAKNNAKDGTKKS